MISSKLKIIFGLSIPLFIAHGLEEYFTGFYDIDSQFRLMILLGVGYIYELHHIIKPLIRLDYYPGLVTALGFPVIALFFWRELRKIWKTKKP